MKAVLIAGGKGTRLYPYTATFPKPLVPIGNMPIIEILIRQLKTHGFRDITICVGHLSYLIKAYFGSGKNFGVKIKYSEEKKILGTAAPLSLLKELPKTFLVANGDLLTDANFKKMYQYHKKKKAALTVGVYKRYEKIELGVLDTINGLITAYREKPVFDFTVSTGVYIFDKSILEYIPKNKYFDFPSLVNSLLKQGKKVIPFEITGYWLDIGMPEDFQKAIDKFTSKTKTLLK